MGRSEGNARGAEKGCQSGNEFLLSGAMFQGLRTGATGLTRAGRGRWPQAVLALLLLAAGLMLVEPLAAIPRRAERDFNEGLNALKARRLARGESLYPAADSLLPNIYPPGSFLLLSRFSDPMRAGRIVALAGLVLTAALLGAIVRRGGGSGTWTAVFVVAYMAAHHNSYVAMNDPQWLAHAIMTAGLAVLIGHEAAGWRTGLACGLMLIAGLCKHTLWAAPLAVTWWLWCGERRQFWIWCGTAAALLAVTAAAMLSRYGWETLAGNLLFARPYRLAAVGEAAVQWAMAALPLAAGAVWLRGLDGRDRVVAFFLAYAAMAVPWGLALRGGVGADGNHLFDAAIALSAAGGLLITRCESRWRPALMLGLAATTLVVVPFRVTEWGTAARSEASARADIAWLAAAPGPIMAEKLSLLYWAERDTVADPFDLPIKIALGRADPERLLNAEVETLQLLRRDGLPVVPAAINRRLMENFRLVHVSPNGFFFRRIR